ncbi:MAG: hypothetical protein HDQ94_03900, partial [Desulfovibrio sp.]|nr:hypothetical protein [Desulfovibrio sp.]
MGALSAMRPQKSMRATLRQRGGASTRKRLSGPVSGSKLPRLPAPAPAGFSVPRMAGARLGPRKQDYGAQRPGPSIYRLPRHGPGRGITVLAPDDDIRPRGGPKEFDKRKNKYSLYEVCCPALPPFGTRRAARPRCFPSRPRLFPPEGPEPPLKMCHKQRPARGATYGSGIPVFNPETLQGEREMETFFVMYKVFFWIFAFVLFSYIWILLGSFFYQKCWRIYKLFYYTSSVRSIWNFFPKACLFMRRHKIRDYYQASLNVVKKIFIKNEYWLYRNSTLKSLGRASFLYFLIVCLFLLGPYIYSTSLEVKVDDLLKIFQLFMVITIPFFTYWILSNNSIIYSPAEEINDFLRIFCKSVLLLELGKNILQQEYASDTLTHLDNPKFLYIKNELDSILKFIEKNKYIQPKE